MSLHLGIATTTYPVTLLSVDTGTSFGEFQTALHAAVPEVPSTTLAELAASGADWSELTEATNELAPHGFLRYWASPVSALMGIAHHGAQVCSYLIGNHVIAEQMCRDDPAVMLHAPLRFVLHQEPQCVTGTLTFDLPSSQFACFGDPRIAKVGELLDTKLAALLAHLGAAVPDQLHHS